MVLESGYITFPLRPFHANLGKRLIKREKIYFYDTGLCCFLTGISSAETLWNGPLAGPIFENFVIAETLKQVMHKGRDVDTLFYRDNGGNEIDLILHDRSKGAVQCIEIKAGSTPKPAWAEQLEKTASLLRPAEIFKDAEITLAVVYRGETRRSWPKKGIDFLHYDDFLAQSEGD